MDGKQLRNSILQWAIQGKLVPQDPNDEPASVLLERIREEKARLVKEKKIKRDKNESIIYRGEDNSYYEKFTVTGEVKCIDDEIPFNLPSGWMWCRLNELGTYRKGPFGSSLTKSMFVPKSDVSIKVYEQKNAIQKDYQLGDYYISKDKYQEMTSFVTAPTDIIVSCAGTIGETYLLPKDAPIGIINQALMRVRLYEIDLANYWQMFFAYVLLIENKMKGSGSAIKNIPPFEYLKAILIPIPPLAEQKRIIEKYNLLLDKINQYNLLKHEYDNLNNNIYGTIKKSILQEAIQGKLVPQDHTDEPASILLQRISEEKARLVKEGKLKKKDIVDTVIYRGDDNKYYEKRGKEVNCIDDEIPFDIPNTWEWVRLNYLASVARGGSPRPIKDFITESSEGVNWIKIGDTEKGGKYINSCAEKIKPEGVQRSRMVYPGDFLLTNSMSFGRPYITNVKGCIHDGWLVISQYLQVYDNDFLYYLLSSPFAFAQFSDKTAGAVVQNLNKDKVAGSIFPLPPRTEQIRIIQKIEEIFKILK